MNAVAFECILFYPMYRKYYCLSCIISIVKETYNITCKSELVKSR